LLTRGCRTGVAESRGRTDEPPFQEHGTALGKLVTEKPVDFVGFDNVVEFNKNRQNDDNVVKAYKS
jgi:hypothetical protein